MAGMDIRPLGERPSLEEQRAQLRTASQDFEAIFLAQLWKQMRQGVSKDSLLHSSQEEGYLSMFDQEMGSTMAQAGGIGLADMLYQQLKGRLEQAGNASSAAPVSRPLRPQASLGAPPAPAASAPDPSAAVDALAERIVQQTQGSPESASHQDTAHAPAIASPPQNTLSTASMTPNGEGIWLTW